MPAVGLRRPKVSIHKMARCSLLGRGAAAVLFAVASSTTLAQSGPVITLVAGAMQYDLRGTGTAPLLGVRVDVPGTRLIIFEPGLTYSWYVDGADRVSWLIPEAQVQFQASLARVRPYVGFGGGVAWSKDAEDNRSEAMLSLALGTRFGSVVGWGGRGELRLRSIKSLDGIDRRLDPRLIETLLAQAGCGSRAKAIVLRPASAR